MSRIKSFILVAVIAGIISSLGTSLLFYRFKKPEKQKTGMIQPAYAGQTPSAYPVVTGSPYVAVAAYKSSSNTYILWSDGTVSTTTTLPYYQPATANPARPTGSPNVAVGIVQDAPGYILYSNGDIKPYPPGMP